MKSAISFSCLSFRKRSLSIAFTAALALAVLPLATGCGPEGNAGQSRPTGGTVPANASATNPSAANPNATTSTGADAAAPTNPTDTSADSKKAEQILRDMETAYRKADSYADNGVVRRKFTRNGESMEQLFDFSIDFVRPNRLRLDCYGVRVVSDAKDFYASVPQVPNQVMKIAAPKQFTPEELLNSDPQLGNTLVQGPAGPPAQLPLLLSDDTIGKLMKEAKGPPTLLPQEKIDDQTYNRVAFEMPTGALVLWIDPQTSVLRRLEMPVGQVSPALDQPQEKTTALIVDCAHAQLNPKVDDLAFTFQIPEGAKVTSSLVEELKPADIAPHSDPTTLKLTKLWTAADVKDPGNVLVVSGADNQPHIFALEGAHTVIEIDPDGKTAARHELDLPPEAIITYLRTATDAQGKHYFVGSASGQSQVFLFDENWQRVLSFPKAEEVANSRIAGVQIGDLQGDGKLNLFVGYWQDVGLQGVSLAGERLWQERTLQYVLPCAFTDPDSSGARKLICTHSRGTIVLFSGDGKPQGEVVVPDRYVALILGADLKGDGKNEYCALTLTSDSSNEAVGLSLDGKQLWNYALPAGVPRRPIEMITTGDVLTDVPRAWLFAGADGSIHIVGEDGKPIDKWNQGASLNRPGRRQTRRQATPSSSAASSTNPTVKSKARSKPGKSNRLPKRNNVALAWEREAGRSSC